MIMSIYKKAFAVCMKKPLRLWGVSLLNILLISLSFSLFGVIPGVAIGLGLLFSTAMAVIFLRGYRGYEPKSEDLFYNFADGKRCLRVLGGMGWKTLWVIIFSLIPIVGVVFAVIKNYEYALCPYILSFEPDVKPTEAIKVSKQRTEGYKGKMFLADILPVVAVWLAVIILGLLAMIPVIGFIFALAAIVVTIAAIILLPLFLGLVRAAFYEEIMESNGIADPSAAFEPEANEAEEGSAE